MRLHGLDQLFEPRSVAVIGASANPRAAGGRLLGYLLRSFPGEVHAVNPRRTEVQGVAAVRSTSELPAGIDLAVVAVPQEDVPGVVTACVERDVGAIVLFTAGFAETGAEGASRQAAVMRLAADAGIRVLGPNSLGVVNVARGLYATFTSAVAEVPPGGPLAIVSQSGGMGSIFLSVANQIGLGVGYFVATGNEGDVDVAEVAEHLVAKPDVGAIMMFTEGIKDGDALRRAAGIAHELDKPLVMAKVGRTEAGSRAALSHSAAVVGTEQVYAAALDQLGIIRVEGLDGLLDAARVFQTGRRARGPNVGVVTASGGGGVLLADAAADHGLELPAFSVEQQGRLADLIPSFGSTQNPVDITAQVTAHPAVFGDVLTAVADMGSVDVVCAFLGALDHVADDLNAAVEQVAARTDKPVVVGWGGGSRRYKTRLNELGVPTYDDPGRAMAAIGMLVRHSLRTGPGPAPAPRVGSAPPIRLPALEHEAKELLGAHGIPTVAERFVTTVDQARAAAAELRYPVVLKVASTDLPHKSDVGGVITGIGSADQLDDAYARLHEQVARHAPAADVAGTLVSRMMPIDLELICGLTRDPVFGPVVSVGLGGVLVEIVAATELCICPLTPRDAENAIRRLLHGRLVGHPRGLGPAAVQAVSRIMVALADLAAEHPEIDQVDCNPVAVHGDDATVLDALVIAP